VQIQINITKFSYKILHFMEYMFS